MDPAIFEQLGSSEVGTPADGWGAVLVKRLDCQVHALEA